MVEFIERIDFYCVFVGFGLWVLRNKGMASNSNEKGNDDLYAVMGLKKECTTTELRSAYKKLALVSFRFVPLRVLFIGQ